MKTTCRTCSDQAIFVPLHNDAMAVLRVIALSHFLVILFNFTLIPFLDIFFSVSSSYAAIKEMEQKPKQDGPRKTKRYRLSYKR